MNNRRIQIVGLMAVALLAYAVSTPLWVGHVASTPLVSVGPEVIIGLVSVVIAILALGAAGVFLLLRQEVIREVHVAFVSPTQAERAQLAAYTSYVHYMDFWWRNKFDKVTTRDAWFRFLVESAVSRARRARQLCATLPDEPHYREMGRQSKNDLAYHLATQCHIQESKTLRQEASLLAKELRGSADDYHIWETLAWVQMSCNDAQSAEYQEGLGLIRDILKREDMPKSLREVTRSKYNQCFEVDVG